VAFLIAIRAIRPKEFIEPLPGRQRFATLKDGKYQDLSGWGHRRRDLFSINFPKVSD
jgi:hypothetical protein